MAEKRDVLGKMGLIHLEGGGTSIPNCLHHWTSDLLIEVCFILNFSRWLLKSHLHPRQVQNIEGGKET